MTTILFIKSHFLKNLYIKCYFVVSPRGEIYGVLLRGEKYV